MADLPVNKVYGRATVDKDDPLETLLGSIRDCLDRDMYYAGLVVALTIPDVCAALEAENGETSKQKYKDWYDAYLGATYRNLTNNDCYKLRCSIVHQGKFGHPDMQYSRVLFTLPNTQNIVFHNNIIDDALNLDINHFCNDLVNAARNWYRLKFLDLNVIENLPSLVKYRPEGLPPYMLGTPLIA